MRTNRAKCDGFIMLYFPREATYVFDYVDFKVYLNEVAIGTKINLYSWFISI